MNLVSKYKKVTNLLKKKNQVKKTFGNPESLNSCANSEHSGATFWTSALDGWPCA